MKTFASIENGSIRETLEIADDQDIYNFFPSYMVWVEITGMSPMPGQQWTYDGVNFAPYVPPPPTPEEVLASQSAILQALVQLANAQKVALAARISTLQDAIDLEMATPEEVAELTVRQAQLLEWKRYAVYLGRVTTQAGWPPDVVWPVQPTSGMDLTVSAVAPTTAQTS